MIDEDKNDRWYKNGMGLGFLFCEQWNLQLTNNFTVPQKLYQGNNETTISTYGLRAMFLNCKNLEKFSGTFKIPEGITDVSAMFSGCVKLSAVIELPLSVSKFIHSLSSYGDSDYFMANTGMTASNYQKCNTPIIVKYPVKNSYADNYTYNVRTQSNVTGKVTMMPITDNTTNWEKVYGDDDAPYYDEDGAYYVRYIGSQDILDIGKSANGIELSAGTNTPCVLNTKMCTTYKMFSYRSGEKNKEIKRVFIPACIAIDEDPGIVQTDGTYSFDENKGIASNTFSGYERSTVEKDVIYHTGKVLTGDSEKDSMGEGITDLLDRTNKISKITYPYVTTYVYLGAENVLRDSSVVVNAESDIHPYLGEIKNVYLSNEVDYPVAFFSIRFKGTQLEYALVDSDAEDKWYNNEMSLSFLFCYQTKVKITDNFVLPNKAYQATKNKPETINDFGLRALFDGCTEIDRIPEGFKIPSTVTDISEMFYKCSKLNGLIEIPENVDCITRDNPGGLFYDAGISAPDYQDYGAPIVVRCVDGGKIDSLLTSANYPTVFIERVTQLSTQSIINFNNVVGNTDEYKSVEDSTQVSTSDKIIIIEDSTDFITITVNEKSVDEVVDETQENSQSSESVEENKSEEDEVQE